MNTNEHESVPGSPPPTEVSVPGPTPVFVSIRVHSWFLLVAVAIVVGCVSKQSARRSYLEGMQRGAAAERARQNQPPTVTVLGDVRQNVIAWSEGLTLAQAITTAQHARRQPPRAILLRRGDEAIRITPEHLFQGGEDPVLEPGDVIELIR